MELNLLLVRKEINSFVINKNVHIAVLFIYIEIKLKVLILWMPHGHSIGYTSTRSPRFFQIECDDKFCVMYRVLRNYSTVSIKIV